MGPGTLWAFPLRFRHSRFRYVSVSVSVAFPFAFPLRFRWARACPTEHSPPKKLAQHCCCCARAAEQIRNQNCFGTVAPTSSCNLMGSIPGVGVLGRPMLPAAPSLRARCEAGPRVAPTECVSTLSRRHLGTRGHIWATLVRVCFNVSATFPPAFPSTFPSRFRHVSVNVSGAFPSTFPLRFRHVSVGQVRARWKLSGNSPSVSGAH